MQLEILSAVQLGAMIAKREVSCREVSKYFLDRVHQFDSIVSAMVNVFDEATVMVVNFLHI